MHLLHLKRWAAVVAAVAVTTIAGLASPANANTLPTPPTSVSSTTSAWTAGWHAPTTAVLGDSIAAAVGNTPYIPPSDVDGCHRSLKAYGPLLAQAGLINLPSSNFVPCSGAAPADLLATYKTEPPQVNVLSAQTQLVLLQIGANPVFGQAAGLCILGDCSTDPNMQLLLGYIAQVLPAQLDLTYGAVRARAPNARVIVNLYDNPFPQPGSATTYCPYMNQAELGTASQFAGALNGQITAAAQRAGFQVADSNSLTQHLDTCTQPPDRSAFFPVDPNVSQEAWLHLNQLGQVLNAGRLSVAIVFNR